MKNDKSHSALRMWLVALTLAVTASGCDSSRDPVLGTGGIAVLAPTVTAVTPTDEATGVDYRNTVINAAFSEAVSPITGSASFRLSCTAPCVAPSGSVALGAGGRLATYTLAAGTRLAPLTRYTATVTGATSVATGLAMDAPYVWQFTTGIAPTVTAVAPVDNATGVAFDNTAINAGFSEPVLPIGGSSSFTLSCEAPCTSPTATVTTDANGTVATYALAAGSSLMPLTLYTATVAGATSVATGLVMDAPFVWRFTTGIAPDTTRPRVSATQPLTTTPGPTPDVAASSSVTATFSEDMDAASITAASFTLSCAAPCTAPAGSVGYTVGSRTAVYTPAAALPDATTYTATVTTAATDLAGNALAGNQAPPPAASNYVWSFTTAAAQVPPTVPVPMNVTVLSVSPVAGAAGVCPSTAVNVRFDVPSGLRMDPARISSATIVLTGPPPANVPVVAASVVLDNASGRIATFTPQAALGQNQAYTVTVRSGATGVRDLANPANTMAADFSWSFTTGAATGACLAPVPLRSAAPFGVFGGSAGMTNSGLQTVVNGDIGTTAVSTAVTGFHDAGPGCTYTETPLNIGTVNGLIYTAAPPPTVACTSEGTATTFAVATQGRADALIAYNDLVAVPPGPDPGAGSLANLVLAPGVYTSASGSFTIQGGDLTLDAQGDANAVWIFQMATSFTLGGPGASFPQSIVLVNGAQAKNVFWQVGSAATINAAGGGTLAGTLITQTGAAVSTAGNTDIVTVNGRVLSLGASVTLVDTVINVPAP